MGSRVNIKAVLKFEKTSSKSRTGHPSYLFVVGRAEPSRAQPSRAEPSPAEASRAEPSRAEPSPAEASRGEPTGLGQPRRAAPRRAQPGPAWPGRENRDKIVLNSCSNLCFFVVKSWYLKPSFVKVSLLFLLKN